MFDFLDNPVFTLILFGMVTVWFLGYSIAEMPKARDKKTGKQRGLYQRWSLANRDTRWMFIGGCAAAVVTIMSALELLGLITITGP